MSHAWVAGCRPVQNGVESALSMRALRGILPALLRGAGAEAQPVLTVRVEGADVARVTVSGEVPRRDPLEAVQRLIF